MNFKLKDPGSAITHFIGLVLAVIGTIPLLVRASKHPSPVRMAALSIFLLSMILLYGASTTYHSLDINEKVNRVLRKLDHMMIFVLIAGSYTPICLIVLNNHTGVVLCILIWAVALIGMLIKALWITCPKWFSSVIYIGMGWFCVLAFSQIYHALPTAGFVWLLVGGIIYTIGGVIYALKLPIFNSIHKDFGSHEIFHLFVLGGSICHYIMMYGYIAVMPM